MNLGLSIVPSHRAVGAAAAWLLLITGRAMGQGASTQPQETPAPPPTSQPSPPAAGADAAVHTAPAGILPVPDYTGDLLHRRFLLGELSGARADLANKGFQFELNWNQHVQGVASGGRDNGTRYGGTLDYEFNFDLMRMQVLDLAFVKMRAESRYGESVNSMAGPILPTNTDMFFPLTDELDGGIPFTITSLNLTKLFTPKFGFVVGKLDTLDGDPNEFASGRGASQFMNSNFVFNSVLALRLPYSTLGGGLVWMPNQHISVTTMLLNTADSSTTTGFEDFGDGLTWNTEARFQYQLGSLPGGANAGLLYSFDQDFADLNDRFVFRPGEGLIVPTADDTWAVYFSGWQYVWVKDPAAGGKPVNTADGVPDHQGLGLFWRAGFADEETNPVEWSASGGIGGRGLIPCRERDVFGVGYSYAQFQPDLFTGFAGLQDYTQGFEAFYRFAITPAAHLTLDAQVLESATEDLDVAFILGMRLELTF